MKPLRSILSIVLGLFCCLVIASFLGESPLHVLRVLILGAFGNLTNLGYTLFYTTPLIFTGLSVAVAFRCGLFNIGAEGQLYVGSLFLAALGIWKPDLPLFVALPAGILCGMLGGALWGAIAGALKTYRGSHEVIVTIMLNFIAYALCGFIILKVLKNPFSQNPETAEIGGNYFLPGLGAISESSPVNVSLVLALFVLMLVWVLLFKTNWGFEVRLVGSKPETARRAGINVGLRVIQAMGLSGALAGLVGVNEIMGYIHKFRDGYSPGYGAVGIAVALLGRNKPLGIFFAALIFGALQKGALDMELDTDKITRDLAGVMQAFIILFVASEQYWPTLYEKFLRKWNRGAQP